MKIYTSKDSNSPILTSAAGSFNSFLKHYLIPLGWVVVDETGFTLLLQNSKGKIAKIKDVENKTYLTGLRTANDAVGFPNRAQMLVDGETAVVGSRNTITQWYLFCDQDTFYFVLNGELLSFGSYEPLFGEDEHTHFVIGNQYYLGNQTLIVQPTQASTMLFLEGNLGQFQFSVTGGLSYFNRVDDYAWANGAESFVFASPVVLHDPSKHTIRGFLPDLFVFNNQFFFEEMLYTQGGYKLFGVVIDERCYGVKCDD